MANVRLTDLTRATRLFQKLVDKSDLNGDGAIREGDVGGIRGEAGGAPRRGTGQNETHVLAATLDAFRRGASSSLGTPSLDNIKTLLGQTRDRLRARDKDGDGVIADTERRANMTVCERALLQFAESCKGLSVTDFKIPEAHEWQPGRFSWTGTPQKVCQSLLDAYSRPANDNAWPSWATPREPGTPRASRYVVDRDEAKAMVEALRPLYVSRQKAVLTELAKRTLESTYGCVAPTATGKAVLEEFAAELGLSLVFKRPGTPAIPI